MIIRYFTIVSVFCLVTSKKSKIDSTSSISSAEEEDYYEKNNTLRNSMGSVMNIRGTVTKSMVLELFNEGKKTFACSPLTATLPLAKLLLGVKKHTETEKELLYALGFKSSNEMPNTYSSKLENLRKIQFLNISVVSNIYMSRASIRGNILDKRFVSNSKTIFGTSLQVVDMERPEETADVINSWMVKRTNSRITNVVSSSDISNIGSLLVITAVYFKGYFKQKFPNKRDIDFQTSNGGETEKTMMVGSGNYRYVNFTDLSSEVIEIPFKENNSALIVLRPYTASDLPMLLQKLSLSPTLLNKALNQMKPTEVIVSLPEIKIDTNLDLKYYYDKLGLKKTLSANSDVNYIIRGEKLFISKAVHKVTLDISFDESNKRNTPQLLPTGHPNQILFVVNHPFLFYIKINNDELIAGVVS